jgi:hypothetical protein
MDKRLAYFIIAAIILISFAMTFFIYWQQSQPVSQTPEVYQAGLSGTATINIPNQDLTSEQTATVPIYLTTDTEVASVEIILEYDASILEINDTLTDETTEFTSPPTFTIDDTNTPETARQATISFNSPSQGINTNSSQLLLANLRLTPHLPTGETTTTTPLKIIYTGTITDGSFASTLTATDNILEQPTNPTITITEDTTTDATILSIEEKSLILDQEETIDITLNTPETITAANIIIEYDPTYLEISSTYTENEDFSQFSVDIDETTGNITITANSEEGIDGTLGKITIITLNATPLDTTPSTNMTFDFTLNNPDDTNISTSSETDILTSVNNASFEIMVEEEEEEEEEEATTTITTPKPTPTPTPVIENLPQAGSSHMTFTLLTLGLSALLLGIIVKNKKSSTPNT